MQYRGPERLLVYRLVGDECQPSILFLHGFMGSSTDWLPTAERLSEFFRSILVDLPGHGRTPLPSNPLSLQMKDVVQALDVLLDHLRVERCILVGYSMGGRIALHYALQHPERCMRLILESASPGLRTPSEREARRASDHRLAAQLERMDFAEFLAKWYSQPTFASLKHQPGLLRPLIARRLENDASMLAHVLRTLGTGCQESLWERLSSIEMPVLALAGMFDAKYVAIAREMAGCSPRIRAHVVPGAGHIVHLEKAEEFLKRIKDDG